MPIVAALVLVLTFLAVSCASIEESVKKAFELMVQECGTTCQNVKTYSRIGVPANEIVRFAQEESIDLIVMGTHGWTGFRHLILGSTAENVVRTAMCPVLTVKSPASEPEELGGA